MIEKEIDNLIAAINIKNARKLIYSSKNIVDYEAYIKDINSCVLKNLNPLNGKYRNENKLIGNCFYEPPSPKQISGLMNSFATELSHRISDFGSELNKDAILIASEAHCKLARIQPFDDGNKRTARILADTILKNTIDKMIDYENFDMDDYINRTLIYYNTQDVKPFYDFLRSNVLQIDKELDIRTLKDIEAEQRLFAQQMNPEFFNQDDYNINI